LPSPAARRWPAQGRGQTLTEVFIANRPIPPTQNLLADVFSHQEVLPQRSPPLQVRAQLRGARILCHQGVAFTQGVAPDLPPGSWDGPCLPSRTLRWTNSIAPHVLPGWLAPGYAQRNGAPLGDARPRFEDTLIVAILEEDRRQAVAAVDDVVANPGKRGSRSAWHGMSYYTDTNRVSIKKVPVPFSGPTGEWPTTRTGAVMDAAGEIWADIHASLRVGCRGLRPRRENAKALSVNNLPTWH
jgi:hypothetical protein